MLIPLFTVKRDDRKSGHNQLWSLTFRFSYDRMAAFLLHKKDKAFYHWISSPCAQNSSYNAPSTKRNTQTGLKHKNIQHKQRGKIDLCLFQCNAISISCVSVFLAQLCKIIFFVFSLWKISEVQIPKYIDLVIRVLYSFSEKQQWKISKNV